MTAAASTDAFPAQRVRTPFGAVQWRESGQASAVTHVLLHGIGSGSASWLAQLTWVQDREDLRVLAWDAPGYGQSDPVANASPQALDYARHLWAWLDALHATSAVVLVGHSLGCLMAASAAALAPERMQGLVLLAPARGYGDAPAPVREEKLRTRLETLARLGPEGMAAERAHAMLSPTARPEQIEAVRATMAQIQVAGYTQAAHMLANAVLARDLAQVQCPRWVASGEADGITPASACQAVAQDAGVTWQSLGPVGHACAIEAAAAVHTLLGWDQPARSERVA